MRDGVLVYAIREAAYPEQLRNGVRRLVLP